MEGSSLLPDRVAEVMGERTQGIWIVPTERFQRAMYRARGAWVEDILRECEDPERAYRNWMDRDVAFARWVGTQTQELGLKLMEVDDGRTITENAKMVAEYFQLGEWDDQ